jgi:gliding-associated putative ABC transporter substrate-binding component GldG
MRQKSILQFLIGISLLIGFNIFAQNFFFRWDFTEEQRYTITPATKKILHQLDDEVLVKVYLEGELNANFKRLQKAIRETLEEFKMHAGSKLRFKFINPNVAKNVEERKKQLLALREKGLIQTDLTYVEAGKKIESHIFPGALMYYKNMEISCNLFKAPEIPRSKQVSDAQILNQSVENIEYNLISTIRQLTQKERKNVAFLEGHGEAEDIETYYLANELAQYYRVGKVNLRKEPKLDSKIDAIIIAQPDSTFADEEKYKIDQYIMQGGKAIFCLDAAGVYLDSAMRGKGTFTFPYNHNLTDLLFHYGVRINNDLIQDLNCTPIPIVVGNLTKDKPNIQGLPWVYNPLINNFSKHSITRNLSMVQLKMATTMDTVKATGIAKTPLMFTSRYTRTRGTPALVSYEEARKDATSKDFKMGVLPVAYLLEGAFTSNYKNKSFSERKGFIEKGKPSKILVCSDGDIVKSEIVADPKTKAPMPLPTGFDRFLNATFSNKDLIMNALDYMIDDKGVILAKQKQVTLRPLDKRKLEDERTFWQVFALVLPSTVVLLFGFIWFFWRKRSLGK